MSLRTLLEPETKVENWSHLYAYRVETKNLDADDVVINNLVVDSAEVKDLDVTNQLTALNANVTNQLDALNANVTNQLDAVNVSVSADCFIGPNNFNVVGGLGNAGQVLRTNANGSLQWEDTLYEANGLIYRPGGVSAGNVYATWAEVASVVADSNGCLVIYLDDSIVSPLILENLDCQGRVVFRPYKVQALGTVNAEFKEDNQITNPTAFIGPIQITCNSVLQSNFVLSNGNIFNLLEGANITLSPACVFPALRVADNEIAGVALKLGCTIGLGGSPSVFCNVGINATLLVVQLAMTSPLDNDIFSSTDATGQLVYQGDASLSENTNAAFTGVLIVQMLDKAEHVEYDDTVVPVLSVDNVQDALDKLKISSRSFAIGFGSNLALANDYLNVNGDANSVSLGALSPLNECLCPTNTAIQNITYNTTAGDATSTVDVLINGVSHVFNLAGASGTFAALSLPIALANTLAIQFTAGTAPGISNFIVNFGG